MEALKGLLKRLGEPVIRTVVKHAMKEMGRQFVLGRTIEEAQARAQIGYTYSYDMLGEAALTKADAKTFYKAYADAITKLKTSVRSKDIRENPSISVKLSALHPRYEVGQRTRVMSELVPRVLELACMARSAHMGFNVDAEEADRLDLSLDVIEAVLRSDKLNGWDGFGVVVQAYGKRAAPLIDWLYALAAELERKIMVRLVKGAYWDTEIKRAQIDGVEDFPVLTKKAATDVSYICCAEKLLSMADRIYPQFATHNVHTVAAIARLAKPGQPFEYQKLHGMGDALHEVLTRHHAAHCRVYAPVGAHKDLLAYLVRRLMENGANSSFVNQIVDDSIPVEEVVADPFEKLEAERNIPSPYIVSPPRLFMPERENAAGWDLTNVNDVVGYDEARRAFKTHQ